MAEIVLGIGASHGPTIQATSAEKWGALGQKDLEDPRYDFAAFLAAAPPNLADEITPERMRERHEAVQRASEALSVVIQDVSPDVIVCISNPHGVAPPDRMEPVFGMYMSHTESQIERSGHQTSARRRPAGNQPVVTRQVEDYATCPELADHLMYSLIREGVDVASCFQSDPAAGIEGPFLFAYDKFLPDRTIPTVPFLLSRYLPHQATSARCYTVGQAIRRAIESWDKDMRVAVMASGGLSHQVVDEELDRKVIDALLNKDTETLSFLPREQLNRSPGTPEILNWVVVAGATEPLDMTLIDYVPCYRSLAGTGHGVTLAYWK